MTKGGKGLEPKELDKLAKELDPKTVKMIEDETLEFVKTNANHLPMYYVPGEEFPWADGHYFVLLLTIIL